MERSYEVLFLVVILTILGDFTLKVASRSPEPILSNWLLMGALLYGLTAVGWMLLMQNHDLAQIAVIYSSATTITLVFVGYLFFGEVISGRQGLGVIAAIAAVILMEA